MNWNKLNSMFCFAVAAIFAFFLFWTMFGNVLPKAGYADLSWVVLITATEWYAAYAVIGYSILGYRIWKKAA